MCDYEGRKVLIREEEGLSQEYEFKKTLHHAKNTIEDSSRNHGDEDLLEVPVVMACNLLKLRDTIYDMVFANLTWESSQPLVQLISQHNIDSPVEWMIKKLLPLVQCIRCEEVQQTCHEYVMTKMRVAPVLPERLVNPN